MSTHQNPTDEPSGSHSEVEQSAGPRRPTPYRPPDKLNKGVPKAWTIANRVLVVFVAVLIIVSIVGLLSFNHVDQTGATVLALVAGCIAAVMGTVLAIIKAALT
ncbi:MAG: hypothetical protein L0H24_05925 [Microlunatus sp.]|nr:hypothetical protein [Microlunatus sp.]